MYQVLSHAQQRVVRKWRREAPLELTVVVQEMNLNVLLHQQVNRRSSHRDFTHYDDIINFMQRDSFLVSCRGEPVHVPQSNRVLATESSFLSISNLTSSGKHIGAKLQSRQRTAIFPSSGGGGVSNMATSYAWSMAAFTLARNSGVNWTFMRLREPK